MSLLRRFVMSGVRRAMQDPRVQAKVAEVAEREVKPRAQAAARVGREQLKSAAEDWRQSTREADPRERPAEFAGRFAGRLKRRLMD